MQYSQPLTALPLPALLELVGDTRTRDASTPRALHTHKPPHSPPFRTSHFALRITPSLTRVTPHSAIENKNPLPQFCIHNSSFYIRNPFPTKHLALRTK